MPAAYCVAVTNIRYIEKARYMVETYIPDVAGADMWGFVETKTRAPVRYRGPHLPIYVDPRILAALSGVLLSSSRNLTKTNCFAYTLLALTALRRKHLKYPHIFSRTGEFHSILPNRGFKNPPVRRNPVKFPRC